MTVDLGRRVDRRDRLVICVTTKISRVEREKDTQGVKSQIIIIGCKELITVHSTLFGSHHKIYVKW